MGYVFVALTILLTVYGQLVLKWQVGRAPPLPSEAAPMAMHLLSLLLRPWVLSGLAAAFLASMCWMAAVSRFEISRVYPFMALNFLIVGFAAVPLFGETLTLSKIAGLILVVLGLVISSQN
ncbi:EamA family transporter [Dyella silvae]|uniref:EamA family transporter n=1 Tax=Dyella silvae TaxID=2994424 RepID=UPI0022655347|nr:EamA family transporter [Dyella silvae]